MGRVSGATGARRGLTPLHWVETLEVVTPTPAAAWVWLVNSDGAIAAEALTLASATRADLEDAAVWRDPRRGGGRLIRRRLLRALAARVLDCAVSDVEIERDAMGRCSVRAPRRLFASVARRGSWAALAVASAPIGVDLEEARPDAPLPTDVLPPPLRRWVGVGPGAADRFARAWTALEAYAKSRGVGVHEGLEIAAGADISFVDDRLAFEDAYVASVLHGPMRAAVVLRNASRG